MSARSTIRRVQRATGVLLAVLTVLLLANSAFLATAFTPEGLVLPMQRAHLVLGHRAPNPKGRRATHPTDQPKRPLPDPHHHTPELRSTGRIIICTLSMPLPAPGVNRRLKHPYQLTIGQLRRFTHGTSHCTLTPIRISSEHGSIDR